VYQGERFNSITHLIGAVFALIGGVVLVSSAVIEGDARQILGYSIYAFTLFTLYVVSALYHSLSGPSKRILRVLDHQAIYLLIAGTYTPFTLVALDNSLGWWILCTVWAMALFGIIWDARPTTGVRVVPVVLYLAMGWLCVSALDTIIASLSPGSFKFLVAGGVFYTSGILFYALAKWRKWFHGVWHLFVVAGSVSHYFAILLLN
jgi:hemolysin III